MTTIATILVYLVAWLAGGIQWGQGLLVALVIIAVVWVIMLFLASQRGHVAAHIEIVSDLESQARSEKEQSERLHTALASALDTADKERARQEQIHQFDWFLGTLIATGRGFKAKLVQLQFEQHKQQVFFDEPDRVEHTQWRLGVAALLGAAFGESARHTFMDAHLHWHASVQYDKDGKTVYPPLFMTVLDKEIAAIVRVHESLPTTEPRTSLREAAVAFVRAAYPAIPERVVAPLVDSSEESPTPSDSPAAPA